MFGLDYLPATKGKAVAKVLDGMDPHNKTKLPQPLDETVQLDRIVEKQMMAYIFNRVVEAYGSQYRLKQIKAVAKYVSSKIANADASLVLTKTTTNALKGSACWKFLDDLITGHTENPGLHAYLQHAHEYIFNNSHGRLSHDVTREISIAIYESVRRYQRMLRAGNDEDSLKEIVAKELQTMVAAMQFK